LWSDAIWERCLGPFELDFRTLPILPQIGCDTARGRGRDYHAIHIQWGGVSFHHETSNTMDAVRIAARLRLAAQRAADLVSANRHGQAARIDPKAILILIDDDGTGDAITSILRSEGYYVQVVSAASRAQQSHLYPNKRSELWFQVRDKAKAG